MEMLAADRNSFDTIQSISCQRSVLDWRYYLTLKNGREAILDLAAKMNKEPKTMK